MCVVGKTGHSRGVATKPISLFPLCMGLFILYDQQTLIL
jgi:hypothetical protein